MDDFELAERDVLAALFIDSHGPGARLLDTEELAQFYHVYVSDKWFDAIVADLKAQGLVMAIADKESSSAVLLDAGYKAARRRVLEQLGATQFQVDWKKEEILTDAEYADGYPLPSGWRWQRHESDKPEAPKANPEALPEVEGTAEGIPSSDPSTGRGDMSGDTVGRDLTHSEVAGIRWVASAPPAAPQGIDWTKWGTIMAAIGVVIAAITLFAAL